MMMLAIRRVLSVDQWKKLQAIHHRHMHERDMGRGRYEGHFRGPPRSDAPPQPPAPPDAPGAPGDK
jgi:hypothetical protein